MKMRCLILMLVVVGVADFAQEQQPIQDLDLLIGKQVIVQRIALCQPGTSTAVFTYAGKPATVVSLKPKKMQRIPPSAMSRIPQGQMREDRKSTRLNSSHAN